MIRVLIADDHPVVRNGLRAVLALDSELRVVADVGSVNEAVLAAAGVDVVLMDLQFGAVVEGIEATRRIRALADPPQVLVLTTYDAEADVLAALSAGASGYLLKDADPETLTAAVHRVMNGETALAPSVSDRLVRRVQQPSVALSERELEVLALVGRGLSNDEIARELFLSVATVKTHLVHVFDKLGVDSRTGAVATATERGLLRH